MSKYEEVDGYVVPRVSFEDIDVMEKPSSLNDPVICNDCKGRGKWNIKLNAYGPGRHFQQMCGACWSWGWVERGTCLHRWCPGRSIANCLTVWKCMRCGDEREVDSSG